MNIGQQLDRTWPLWREWVQITRFDKPVGSYLLLWPTWWALWVAAEGIPTIANLIIFTLGVFIMRSAGCVINDYADRHIDRHVERTRNRPLTQGRLTEKQALAGFALLCFSAFLLVLATNWLTIGLSLGGVALAALYPFMKRHTHLPQVFLGLAFSWAIPMAFAAEANELTVICWLLFIAKVSWTVGYDTIYAMVDRDDDLKIGVKSTAVLFGDLDVPIIAILFGMAHFCMLAVGLQLALHWIYFVGWLAGFVYLGWQIWKITPRQRDECFLQFRRAHWYGVVMWLSIVTGYALQ